MRRILTAVILFPLAIYLVLWASPWLFWCAVATVACLCYYEYDRLAAAYGFGAPGPLGFGAGLLLLVAAPGAWPWLILVLAALAALALAMRAQNLAHALPRAALLALGILYIFGSWKCALALRSRNPHWLFFTLLVSWAGDIGAYYIGRNLGRRRMAHRISPGKTWEGAAGSLAASALFASAYLVYFVSGVHLPAAIALTLIANAAGQVGDLCESAIKRGAGVKDSGSLLPGHGGMLDRVDSAMFVMPVVYACLQLTAPLQ
jgi:phosphatidate cytidylyltransferase